MDFFHWRMSYYRLIFCPEVTCDFDEKFVIYKQLFISFGVNWWTGVMWITCGFVLLFWRHPFTAEDPLVSKWCTVMLTFSSKTNSSTSWIAWRWVHFKIIFFLGWDISLRKSMCGWFNKYLKKNQMTNMWNIYETITECFGQYISYYKYKVT